MNTLKKHIALFLFVVLSVYIVPKELVHELYSHHDTIDISAHEEDVPNQVSSGHLHCFILMLPSLSFASAFKIFNLQITLLKLLSLIEQYKYSFSTLFTSPLLRAPPIAA